MTVNPINPRQQFVPNDRIRLEVETTPTTPDGLVNIATNPSGDLGAWGWSAHPTVGQVDIGGVSGVTGLRYTQTVAGTAGYIQTYQFPVEAGEWVSARYDLLSISASRNVKVRFNWADSNRAFISATSDTGTGTTAGTYYATAAQAPANTKYVRVVFFLYNGTSGAASLNETFVIKNVMVTKNATNSFTTVRTNLVTNPSFESNTTGWAAGNAGTLSRPTSGGNVGSAYAQDTGDNNSFAPEIRQTTTMPVTAGQDYALSAVVRCSAGIASGSQPLRVTWLNSSGSAISSSLVSPLTSSLAANTWSARLGVVATAPAGATKAQVSAIGEGGSTVTFGLDAVLFEQASTVGSYFDGSSSLAGYTCAWTGTTNNSTSTATTTSNAYAFVEPRAFQNILGGSHEIDISRAPLDASTMTAVVVDPDLDPADDPDDALAVGRQIRAMAQVYYDDFAVYVWEPIYTGTINDVVTEYVPVNKATGETRTRITVSATDAAQTLANLKASDGFEQLAGLTKTVLPGTNVPYLVNYVSYPYATATVVSRNDDASVLDQVAITRDCVRGRAFVDRKGRLQAWDPNYSPLDIKVSAGLPSAINGTVSGNGTTGTVTTTAAGTVTLTRMFPVEMGQTYDFYASLATTGTKRSYTMNVEWLLLDYTTVMSGAPLTATATEDNGIDLRSQAPQGAYGAKVTLVISSSAAAQVHTYTYGSRQNAGVTPFVQNNYGSDDFPLTDRDDSYSDIDVSFATHSVINSVTVNWNRYDAASDSTTQVVYGPYVDQNSIDAYGPYSATYTLQGASESATAIEAYADAVLAANATPVRQANSITVPVWDDESMRHAVLNDLTTPVVVSYYDATRAEYLVDSTVRIATIIHTITTDKWLVAYTFDPVDSVAAPQVTPVPTSGSSVVPTRSLEGTISAAATISTTTDTTPSGGTYALSISGPGDVFLVTWSADYSVVTTGTGLARLRVDLQDSTATTTLQSSASAVYKSSTAGDRATVSQTWRLTGVTAGSYRLRLQASLSAASGSYSLSTQTRLNVVKVA